MFIRGSVSTFCVIMGLSGGIEIWDLGFEILDYHREDSM